jgi:hypothetical protein
LLALLERTGMRVFNGFSGHQTWLWKFKEGSEELTTLELNPKLEATHNGDILGCDTPFIRDLCGGTPDVMIMSCPCTCFSVASISTHWTKGDNGELYVPKSEAAREAIRIVKHTVQLIVELEPKYFIIENPRGVLRKLGIIPDHWDHEVVWYCKYSDERAKPTDLWGRFPPSFVPRPPCYNGATANGDCHHEPAPRGSKTGTQGRATASERSWIPRELAEDWTDACRRDF